MFNTELSDAERELLACTAEEAGEIVQAVGKSLRHGLSSRYGRSASNAADLAREIGELHYLTQRLVQAGVLSQQDIVAGAADKAERFRKYSHFQEDSEWRENR